MEVEPFAEAQGENSRLTIPLNTFVVTYYYSTSIWRMDTFIRMIAQREENKGVELTGGGTTAEELRNRQAESSGEPGLLVIEGVEGTGFESEGTSDVQDVKRASAQKRGVLSSYLLRQLVSGGGKGDDLHDALLDIFAEQTVDFRCFGGQQFFSE